MVKRWYSDFKRGRRDKNDAEVAQIQQMSRKKTKYYRN